MSSDAWKDREKAAEDSYFAKENQAALERMKSKQALKSPVSGEPMEQISMHGFIIDRCKQTGGVWLDAHEFEALVKADNEKSGGLLSQIFSDLFKKA